MRSAISILVVAVCLVARIVAAGETDDTFWETEDRATFGDYEFEVRVHAAWIRPENSRHRSDEEAEDEYKELIRFERELTIRRNGRLLHRLEDQHVSIDTYAKIYFDGEYFEIGDPITGTGVPILVAVTYSGGAHCCWGASIFEIGDHFRVVDELDFPDSHFRLKNLDDDPALEIEFTDTNFAYWNTGFASSPAPPVVLKYRDGHYRIATDLMHLPPLSEEELNRRAEEIRLSENWQHWSDDQLEPKIWGVMLDLIYSGNYRQAEPFYELAWPRGGPRQDEIRFEFFRCQLLRSRYWPDIARMNGLEVVKPDPLCPPCPECG